MDQIAKVEKKMPNLKLTITSLFSKSIQLAYPDIDDVQTLVQAAQSDKFGDYQCNSAMVIAKVTSA